jgi:uncharacterized protein
MRHPCGAPRLIHTLPGIAPGLATEVGAGAEFGGDSSPTTEPASAAHDAPPRFSLLAKPSGAACNIDCTNCVFLFKGAQYSHERQRMSEETLDTYIASWSRRTALRRPPSAAGAASRRC